MSRPTFFLTFSTTSYVVRERACFQARYVDPDVCTPFYVERSREPLHVPATCPVHLHATTVAPGGHQSTEGRRSPHACLPNMEGRRSPLTHAHRFLPTSSRQRAPPPISHQSPTNLPRSPRQRCSSARRTLSPPRRSSAHHGAHQPTTALISPPGEPRSASERSSGASGRQLSSSTPAVEHTRIRSMQL